MIKHNIHYEIDKVVDEVIDDVAIVTTTSKTQQRNQAGCFNCSLNNCISGLSTIV